LTYSAYELAGLVRECLLVGDVDGARELLKEIRRAMARESRDDEVSSEPDELTAPEGASGAS